MLRKIEKNITKQYGIIGNPLCHSLSPKFFNERFAQKNIPSEYVKFEISSIEEFPNIIKENPMLVGLNVTIPYKQVIIPYCLVMFFSIFLNIGFNYKVNN